MKTRVLSIKCQFGAVINLRAGQVCQLPAASFFSRRFQLKRILNGNLEQVKNEMGKTKGIYACREGSDSYLGSGCGVAVWQATDNNYASLTCTSREKVSTQSICAAVDLCQNSMQNFAETFRVQNNFRTDEFEASQQQLAEVRKKFGCKWSVLDPLPQIFSQEKIWESVFTGRRS